MDEFTTDLQCTACHGWFRVELRKMRSGPRNICPLCGLHFQISSDQAIKAHRRLEELEHRRKAERTEPSPELGPAIL